MMAAFAVGILMPNVGWDRLQIPWEYFECCELLRLVAQTFTWIVMNQDFRLVVVICIRLMLFLHLVDKSKHLRNIMIPIRLPKILVEFLRFKTLIALAETSALQGS